MKLTRWALDGTVWAWPVSVALLIGLVVALVLARRRLRTFLGRRALVQLAPAVVPFAVLALGAWFACENCSPSSLGQGRRHVWAMRAADTLLIGQVLAALVLVRVAAPCRWVAAVVQAGFLWFSFWAGFMAGMSMSGDWI